MQGTDTTARSAPERLGAEAAEDLRDELREFAHLGGFTGVGGYRVDFAAAHPDDPSRMILAVEATARPTATPAASATATACARSTWSASAGASTACGPPTGSTTPIPRWPSSAKPMKKP